ncbi:MAG: response regulator transcription factor [candidate division KSB1 bacterium]|nr:response regulator transcription factor [candidate division KSB1 bacterium]
MCASPYKGSRILIVEDEEPLAVGLEYNLTAEGYVVTRAADGREALEKFAAGPFDLVILDIMLPYLDGFQVAERLRVMAPQVPILMLTARGAADDRLRGLSIGADDYITKPFHLEELLLRVEGMLRRKSWYHDPAEETPVLNIGRVLIDFKTLICSRGEQQHRLTPQEAAMLKYLYDHPNRIITRQELLQNVWQLPPDVDTRTVDNFIVRLRRLLEDDPKRPQFILSVRGAGYLFRLPPTDGKD